MAIFYVFQGETYEQERRGGYVWSPKRNKNGNKNAGYTNMTYIHAGDYIFHNNNSYIVAVSIAKTDCYSSKQPMELKNAKTEWTWNDDGYRVDTEYHVLEVPLYMGSYREWLKNHYRPDSAFTVVGRGKQQYMCTFAKEHARHFLREICKKQRTDSLTTFLRDVDFRIHNNMRANQDLDVILKQEYEESLAESMSLDELKKKAIECGTLKPKKEKIESSSQYVRNPFVSIYVKTIANGVCELCGFQAPFIDKKGRPYLETHHVKWLTKGGSDAIDNVVALCPNCHRKMHSLDDKNDVAFLKEKAMQHLS